MSLYDLLLDIYVRYGFYKEKLINLVKKGNEGAEEIRTMMTRYRNNPPEMINNCKVLMINDYEKQISHDILNGTKTAIDLIASDVLQFFLEDGTKISVRPSGTEPKIKFYFSVNTKLASPDRFEETEKTLDTRISDIIKDLKLI